MFRRDDDTLDVLVPSRRDGEEQARIELTFFLNAWALDHPRAGLRVGRYG